MAINKKRRHAKRRGPRKMTALQRKYFGKGHARVNPGRRRHAKKRHARRNPSPAILYGVANPRRRRRYAKRRSNPSSSRGGLLSGLGDIKRFLSPTFLMQAAGAGAGLLAVILVPNWLFSSFAPTAANPTGWYKGWLKQGVRAATGLIAFPLVTRMLPPAVQNGFASGVLAGVGVGAVAEVMGRALAFGPEATDIAQTPETFFRSNVAGLDAPIARLTRNPFGAAIAKTIPNPFGGVASDLGMTVVPHVAGRDLVSMLYDKSSAGGGVGF